jgi:hypothetical protein
MSETNPLIANLKLPGRIFQLPSRGEFYKNGELSADVRDGEIHIHPMAALDEINMKNPDQLFSGAAVNTVFKQCISGIEKPAELLSKDVDAIMMYLRVVTYGPTYEFNARHFCEGGKEHSYIADIDTMINTMTIIDPTTIEDNYTVTLQNGQVVKLQPNKYQQVLDLIKLNSNKTEITAEDQQKNLIMMMMGVIKSVDDITDIVKIEEWTKKIPSPMVNRIAKKVENVNSWGPTLKWTCNCKDCGKDFEVEIPINPISFFTE